jgi:hypothetical protein
VLNIDAGQGTFTELLAAAGFEVVSIERGETVIAALRERVRRAGADADMTALPFAADSYDAVVLSGVLEHIAHGGLALREAGRMLVAGDVLCLSVQRIRDGSRRVTNRPALSSLHLRGARAASASGWISARARHGLGLPGLRRSPAALSMSGQSSVGTHARAALNTPSCSARCGRGSRWTGCSSEWRGALSATCSLSGSHDELPHPLRNQ